MTDYKFLQNPVTGKPVILAPRRAKRPEGQGTNSIKICPFCPGNELAEKELYSISAKGREKASDTQSNWAVRVIPNKFPFTPHHEIVILSPDHHKSFDELPFSQIEIIMRTYRERYNVNRLNGLPYIFHNGGLGSGESIPHPHTQIAVVPFSVEMDIPGLDGRIYEAEANNELSVFSFLSASNLTSSIFKSSKGKKNDNEKTNNEILITDHFMIFCPPTSDWPDEVWVAPKRDNQLFGSITDIEITDLAFVISRLIQIFDLRHGNEFPFNFYIYPGKNWYFRLIPRMKVLGGFEVGTKIMVNSQDPKETFSFIKENFWQVDANKIRSEQQADYARKV